MPDIVDDSFNEACRQLGRTYTVAMREVIRELVRKYIGLDENKDPNQRW